MSTFKEGELYKRGKINTDWKLRTFILDSKMLSYFKGGRASPSGTICLTGITEVTPFEENGEFHVVTDKRVYDFRGVSRDDGLQWRQAIIDACLDAAVQIKF